MTTNSGGLPAACFASNRLELKVLDSLLAWLADLSDGVGSIPVAGPGAVPLEIDEDGQALRKKPPRPWHRTPGGS
jgi:hypothetical protein